MPKTKFQEVIFTVLMVLVMVYAMICYNISLNVGGLANYVFLSAFHELWFMGPIAFVFDFFIVSHLAFKGARRIADPQKENPFHFILAISCISVAVMCPAMSFIATVFFKDAGKEIIAVWLQTTVINFPMAFFLQIFYAGPLVRAIFKKVLEIFRKFKNESIK